jgi:hypothetical protein
MALLHDLDKFENLTNNIIRIMQKKMEGAKNTHSLIKSMITSHFWRPRYRETKAWRDVLILANLSGRLKDLL